MPFTTVVDQSHGVVEKIDHLVGLPIPNPQKNQGAVVYVVDVQSWYGLTLDSGQPIDGVYVLGTLLNSDARWLLLNLQSVPPPTPTPPVGPPAFAFGRVMANGTTISNFNAGVTIHTATGRYSTLFNLVSANPALISVVITPDSDDRFYRYEITPGGFNVVFKGQDGITHEDSGFCFIVFEAPPPPVI